MPSVMVLRAGGGLWEAFRPWGWGLHGGITGLKKETPQSSSAPSTLYRHNKTLQVCNPAEAVIQPCWNPDFRAPASRTMRNKCLLFRGHLVCGILLQRPKWTLAKAISRTPEFGGKQEEESLRVNTWTNEENGKERRGAVHPRPRAFISLFNRNVGNIVNFLAFEMLPILSTSVSEGNRPKCLKYHKHNHCHGAWDCREFWRQRKWGNWTTRLTRLGLTAWVLPTGSGLPKLTWWRTLEVT